MKRNTKRLLSFLLVTMFCLSLLPGTALADFGGEEQGWTLTATEPCKLTITSDTGMINWAKGSSTYGPFVSAVELKEGITNIPDRGFYKCSILTTIKIPASVTTISSNGVFDRCTALTSITVAEGNANFTADGGILYNKDKTELLICPQGMSGAVTIPDSVTKISNSAFAGCTKITGVTIPEDVTTIGDAAFEGCTGLTTVTLPAALTSLGDGVFQGCTGLTSLSVTSGNTAYSAENGVLYNSDKTTLLLYPAEKQDTTFSIPASVTAIEDNAFSNNSHLQTVSASALTSVGDGAFLNCTSLTDFTAKSLDEVGAQAFSGCSNLETFTLTKATSLKTIEQSAFSGCGRLTAAPLAGATSIGDSAFQNCTALTSLSFCKTDNVSIGGSAFSGCTGLTALTIPASVTSIGAKAFDSCNNVGEIIFEGKTPPTCGDNMISVGNVYEFQIIVPEDSESSYQTNLGNTLKDYVSSARKYPLFVNGQQFTSKELSIACGSGTASFDVTTSTLTLTNATIENMGGNYGYGGAINSGLENLTIKLVGKNTIHAEQSDNQDSINSGANCDVKIVSGETGGDMPTLTCDVIDMGRGVWPYTGSENAGNLTVDGVKLTVNDYVFVHHDITFQNGAQVNVAGGLTANHNATITVEGDATNVTVASISMGNGTGFDPNNNKLELTSGTLTITGGSNCAISFNPASTGSIAINGGTFETKNENGKATNLNTDKITVDNSLEMTGSWESGPVRITAKPDGKVAVTVTADPVGAGTLNGGGRYEPKSNATVTAAAKPGYYFIGWYKGETLKSEQTEYTFTVEESGAALTARFGIDYLARAEQAKKNFESALGKDTFEWATLAQAVEAYHAAADFVKNPPSAVTDAETRYAALTTYYQSVTTLNLSNQGIGSGDLAKLALFTGVTELNLSGNKGVTGLTALKDLTQLETLDISGTGVTTLDSLITEGQSTFPGCKNLTAQNLSLNSISALANLVSAEDFNTDSVTKWDFTGSTLPDTEDNRADVETIKTTLGEKFSPPTIQTTPDEPEIPATPVNPGGGGVTTYAVTVEDAENGKVTRSPARAGRGTTVTITTAPDDGYELDKLTVTDARGSELELTDKGNGKYTFRMPASKVTVEAVFTEILPEPLPFIDVDEDAWYADAVRYVYEHDLMAGYGGDLFGPNDELSRAQFCQIIYNMEDQPTVTGSSAFTDVADGAWYANAVTWAAENGIVGGYGGGLFGPEDNITREQFAAILYRYAQAKGYGTTASFDLSAYGDVSDVSAWAISAMQWACGKDIINGTSPTTLAPQGTATRAQAATMLQRFCEQYSQNEG